MSRKKKRREIDKIKFSIGAKLITIISIIVILSLGSITVLVSWMVQQDLRISAEENNFEINRRSAVEAETTLTNILSNSRVLMQNLTALGPDTPLAKESLDFFFAENPQIGAFYFIFPGRTEQILINERFFSSRGINEALAQNFFQNSRNALGRAVRGETVLINGAPDLSHACLALLFPWQGTGVGGVLFSSESLNSNFGYGTNKSYMINNDGDVLVHSDFSLVRSGMNVGNEEFIRFILDSTDRSKQQLIESDFNFNPASAASVPEGRSLQSAERGDFIAIAENFFVNLWDDFLVFIRPALNMAAGIFPQLDRQNGEEEGSILQFVAFTKLNTAGVTVITSIEYNKVFEGIAATTRRNIYLTVAVLSISIILIWFFAKSISIPLKVLAQAARQIEGGIFELDLELRGNDEIGVLTGSFQKMSSALKVFGRFTNKEIAVKAMRGEIKPGGLLKHGTVFFSDIREFTAKSENFTRTFGEEASDRIVFWLNEYFSSMVDCIEKTNGVVDKFIGDAVMAHWGTAYTAGSPRKDAFNCVKAALMMRRELFYLNIKRDEDDPGNPSIRIGCGINSGIITAGQLGSDMRMEYTVIGDPVNLASRIEALTKPLGADILISEDTWKLVGDKFLTEEMPPVSVKGKEKPVRIFAVINFAGEPKGPQSMAEVRSLLGLPTPDFSKIDVNADEKKYKIGDKK